MPAMDLDAKLSLGLGIVIVVILAIGAGLYFLLRSAPPKRSGKELKYGDVVVLNTLDLQNLGMTSLMVASNTWPVLGLTSQAAKLTLAPPPNSTKQVGQPIPIGADGQIQVSLSFQGQDTTLSAQPICDSTRTYVPCVLTPLTTQPAPTLYFQLNDYDKPTTLQDQDQVIVIGTGQASQPCTACPRKPMTIKQNILQVCANSCSSTPFLISKVN